jgi:DNA adenine methylase
VAVRYLGGKTRIAKQLADVIDSVREPGQVVWDAFCGGLSTSVALSRKGPVWSTDVNVALVAMYKAIQAGWDPPDVVDEHTYKRARDLPDTDPLKAYAGFCASFGGKYFGGYARGENRNWAAEGKRGLKRDLPGLNVDCLDFMSVSPTPLDVILYLDPPYAGTTGYAVAKSWDSAAFVERVREWSHFCDVFISEYAFTLGECVWSREQLKRATVGPGATAVEKLFFIPKGLYEIDRTVAEAV